MLIPLRRQEEYVKIDRSLKEITDRLSETGSHVESVYSYSSSLEGVLVGKILELEDHPNADRLSVLKIDIGEKVLTIVTSAKNVKKGDLLPVITSGTKLDDGRVIEDHDFFGITSQGMLVAYSEIGYPDSVIPKKYKDGVIILNDQSLELGSKLSAAIFSDSPIIEYEITPNRPDCLSIIGMARESAASFGQKITYPDLSFEALDGDIRDYSGGIELKTDKCRRFTARLIKDVKIDESPLRLKNYLTLAGMRPINNVVDLTNFVMLETGQPLHAYDLDKLAEKKIIIRDAKDGEKVETLDGQERELDSQMVVVCDGEKVVDVAGVMGSMDSEVTESTKNILLEAANFDPDAIRYASKKLNLRSEASSRFEKGVPIEAADFASRRVAHLATKLGIGRVLESHFDEGIKETPEKKVDLRISRLNLLTGHEFTKEEAIENLKLLEFEVEDLDENTIRAKVPCFRNDIDLEADLIEEVVRLYGIGKVENKPLVSSLKRGEKSEMRIFRDQVRSQMVGQKFSEIVTYSFISPREYDKLNIPENSSLRKYIKLINPLGEDYSVMRTTLLPNMLQVLERNLNRKQDDLRFFELGKIFKENDGSGEAGLPLEEQVLCLALVGDYSFYDLKGYFLEAMKNVGLRDFEFVTESENPSFHPGRCARIFYNGEEVGVMGQISYEVSDNYSLRDNPLILDVNLTQLKKYQEKDRKYQPLPKFPALERDYSFVCQKEVESKYIEDTIKEEGKGLVYEIRLFDIYTGKGIEEGEKSLSYKVKFIAEDRTLTDEDISPLEEAYLGRLSKEGIVLRS